MGKHSRERLAASGELAKRIIDAMMRKLVPDLILAIKKYIAVHMPKVIRGNRRFGSKKNEIVHLQYQRAYVSVKPA